MSAMMKFEQIEKLCHNMEDLLDNVRKNRINIVICIDILLEACDFITKSIQLLETNQQLPSAQKLIHKLNQIYLGIDKKTENNSEIFDIPASGLKISKVSSINIKVDLLDSLMNLSEEILITKMQIGILEKQINNKELTTSVENLGRLISDLRFLAVQIRLVPLEYIFNRFPRMVRDLAKEEHKEIDLQIQGSNIELDRSIIDELGECLIHILRNAIDHGIESKETRAKMKKYDIATLMIYAQRKRNFVSIEISDDGSGINEDKVKEKAIKKNLITADASQEEILQSIFYGLSTTQKVSTISGRGFGLRIVKQKIESLGGTIEVFSKPGKGATFVLQVPLTLAIIRALFVEVHQTIYAIPITNIIRLVKIPKSKINRVMHKEAIVIDGQEIIILRLNKLFNNHETELDKVPIVIVHYQNRLIGIAVDRFDIMDDIVIKPMCSVVKNNQFFSGLTVIGSGLVVLILDIASISRSAFKSHAKFIDR